MGVIKSSLNSYGQRMRGVGEGRKGVGRSGELIQGAGSYVS